MTRTRLAGVAILVGWMAGFGGTACMPSDSPPRANTAREDTVTVLYYSANVDTWQDFGMPVLTLLFLPLMHEHGGEIQGRLATSREMSPDGRSWTYHLRGDVQWHDGTPVTAHDVKFTIDLFQHPDLDNPLAVQAGRGASVEVIDDSTLTITFGQYRSDFVWVGREVFLPRHLLEDLDPAEMGEWEFWESPVGNGPYRFVRMVPNQYIELEANPDYFRGEPSVHRVIIRVMGNAFTELQAGNADLLLGVGSVTAESFADDPRFQIYQSRGGGGAIHWNHRDPTLGDPVVRRALSLAIDRSELAAAVGSPAEGPIPDVPLSQTRWLRRDLEGVPEPLGPDPEAARELLSNAGWKDTDGDGILEREGRPLRFTMLAVGEQRALVLREQFRRIGASMEISTMNKAVMRNRVSAGDFQAIIDAAQVRRLGHGPLSATASTLVGYWNDELARLEAALDTTFLESERERIYAQSWPIFQRDLPATLLEGSARSSIVSSRIRGVSGREGVNLLMHLDEVWIGEPVEDEGRP